MHDKLNVACGHLSGGEYQRLSIAQVFVQDPEIYLFDEPTNHLDYVFQKDIFNGFTELVSSKQKTVMVVTHDINWVAKHADYACLLYPNKVPLYGPTDEILNETNLSELYNTKLSKELLWDVS